MDPNDTRVASESGPGAWLRQAREDRGLPIEEVGRALNLSLRHLQSLEDDAYDKLPGPTYVRGYLRGYAMLLGIAPQPLLDAFNRLPVAAQRNEMVAPAPVRQVTSSDSLVRLGTVLIVGLVIGLAALWWGGQDGSSARRRPPAAAQVAAAPRTPELPADAASAPAEAPAKPAPEAGTAAPARPVEPAAPVVTPEKRPPVTAPAAPAAVAERPVPADPNAPRARLVLRVEEDTWADVRDADDRRLLYQTIAAGRVVSVEGVAPLNVFLGNVDGVRVEFNGQSYDARAHKRGHVARFTLGAAGPRR